MRSRSASATALRMVNTSLEMPLPVTSPPRSIVCRLTPLLLQPFEYTERVQGSVPCLQNCCMFSDPSSATASSATRAQPNPIRPAQAIFAGQ
jgi:hypothetical protein